MGAEFRLENMRQSENRRRRAGDGSWVRLRRSTQIAEHPIGLIQSGDIDDAQHRVEDDPGSVGAESARHLAALPQEHDRGKSSLKRDLWPHAGFGDDGEERGLAVVDQAPFGRERRKRSLRRGVYGRSEEGEHDGAAREGIEGQLMAA